MVRKEQSARMACQETLGNQVASIRIINHAGDEVEMAVPAGAAVTVERGPMAALVAQAGAVPAALSNSMRLWLMGR